MSKQIFLLCSVLLSASPLVAQTGDQATLELAVGDHSGSESERYHMKVLRYIEGNTIITHIAPQFGVVYRRNFNLFRKGQQYTVYLKHLGTEPEYEDEPRPDYDYTAEVKPVNGTPALVFRDPQGIMGVHDESDEFFAEGKSFRIIIPKVEFVTPKEDPETAPSDSGEGQNEFTFDDASPGVLKVPLKFKIIPDITEVQNALQDKVKITIDAIGTSHDSSGPTTLTWDHADSGNPKTGNAVYSNGFWEVEATFTGLPENQTDFGRKTIKISMTSEGGTTEYETDIEVFYDRDAENHPELGPHPLARPLNWFYYWRQQLVDPSNVVYGGASGTGVQAKATGMVNWSYTVQANKSEVVIYQETCTEDMQYGVGELFSGIDYFLAMVTHERKHVEQITNADGLVPTGQANSPWRYGWSWRINGNHNHFDIGPDGVPGRPNVDDDSDMTVDNLVTTGRGELHPVFALPSQHDDVALSLSDANNYDWPTAWPTPALDVGMVLYGEQEAVDAADAAHDEHDAARDDWGDPGKNHLTLDVYDD